MAVVHGTRSLTYRELAQRVSTLAHALQALDPRPEAVIAVGVPRSAEMVVCVLAAMVAGAAFVPLDPSWPMHRRNQVLADSGAVAALVSRGDDTEWDVPTVVVDLDRWAFDDGPTRTAEIQPAQLAYVIFTSGSTGKPKGAMIRHEAIAERLLWQRDQILMFGGDDAALFKAPLSFDISVNEILLPLIAGGRVVVADPGGEKDPDYLLELIHAQRVTFVYLVSSMLDTLLELDRAVTDQGAPSALESLRHVWCGGEVLTPGLFARFRRQLTTTLYHGYGPAEATIGVSHVIYRDNAERIATSIGRPNPHTQLYVLDDSMQPVPPGVGGELYAAGFLLGRGYVNAAALTASRFVANPFDPHGARMYRTGDLARWTDSGTLEFLGRADNQVKIRGRRIELEEIESQLAEHPAIRQAVVDVHRDNLVGYLVTHDGHTDAAALHTQISHWAHSRLPDYMVPTWFVALETVPLTPNGKTDRRALPAPQIADTATITAPRTPRETLLCTAFAEALDLDAIGVDTDFFHAGGDSIVAIKVVSKLRAQGLSLRPRDMFTHRTAAALAPLLVQTEASAPPTIGATGTAVATPILRWLAEIDTAPTGSALDGFFQGIVLRTPADLTEEVLRSTLSAAVSRHPVLWAATGADAATLTIAPAPPPLALTTVTISDRDMASAIGELRDDLVSLLDPAAGIMIGFAWVRVPSGQGRLLVIAHHVVVDGVSLRILADDIAAAHHGVLPAEETSWRAWAAGLTAATESGQFDADLTYWEHTCAVTETPWGNRPLDPALDTVSTEHRCTVELPPQVSEAVLTRVPQQIHGHVNDAMVAALYLALRQWRRDSYPDDINPHDLDPDALLIEMEGHGREPQYVGDVDLSGTVGWFTTLYPVALRDRDFDWRAASSGGPELGAAVRSIKDQLRAVPSHGLSYGALRYLLGAPLNSAPQVLFNYLGRFDTSPRDWGVADDTHAVLEDRDPAMPLPRLLEVNAEAVSCGSDTLLRATFSWPAGAVADADVARLADLWAQTLTTIATSEDVAGHSPSDFAGVALSPADTLELERRYPGLRDVVPLTSTQTGIYFHSTFNRHHDPYVVQQIINITGPLDHDLFQRATETVARRHNALTAAFTTIGDGTPVAVYAGAVAPDFDVVDARGHADPDTVVAQRARYERERRFDLAAPPLTRYTLVRRTDNLHTMIQTVHHIVADGWSVPVVLDDLLTAYAGDDFDSPAAQFDRFVDWQRSRGQEHDADRAAWTHMLAGVGEPTLVSSVDGGRKSSGYGTRRTDAGSRNTLAQAASRMSVTVSTLLHAAWGVTLGRLAGCGDVLFGTVVSGRDADVAGIESMVGLLVNTIPVRVQWSADHTAAQVARELAARESAVMEHHHLPLVDAREIVGGDQLFDSLMVIENLGSQAGRGGEITFGDIDVIEAPHYPLTVMIAVHDTVSVTVTNDRSQASDTFADAVTATFLEVLAAMVQDPSTPCGRIEVRAPEQLSPAASTGTVTELLRGAADTHHDLTALVVGDTHVSFAGLEARARALSAQLAAFGVRHGDIVALALPRGADAVASIWATLAAGAAYLPLDLSYPPARLEFMLSHARPAVVLVDGTTGLAVPAGSQVVDVNAETPERPAWPSVDVAPLDAASVLFTSGSTGAPKAVVGTHGALANRLSWARDRWPAATRLAKSSLSFIDGTTELLAGLVSGACTILADDSAARDGAQLAGLVREHGVTQLLAVPSLAAMLVEEHPDHFGSLNRWIVSGEDLRTTQLAQLARTCPQAAVVNSYGSSEVTGDVLTAVQSSGEIILGAPVPGAGVHILDRTLRTLPDGVIGEIYVSGCQLARGYLNAPAATATRFVAAAGGGRLYRTGDLGARLPDGSVVFAGRADDQLTINGHRVEPGEVESALLEHNGVHAAAVVSAGSGLAAFVTGDCADTAALRAMLVARLPRHLVPATIQMIDAIPLLPNGKKDSAALRASVRQDTTTTAVAPENEVQRLIVTTMADVLGRPTMSADADFFAAGGDSISAIRLTSRLARAGLRVTTEDVFRHRDAFGLSTAATVDSVTAAAPIPRFGTSPLSPAATYRLAEEPDVEDIWAMSPLQQGVYYQSTLSDGAGTYLAQNIFDFDRPISIPTMRIAFDALLRRHPQLRAGFHSIDDGDTTALAQVIRRVEHPDIQVVDIRDGDPETARAVVDTDRTAPFDLRRPPLLRLTVIRMPGGRDRLLVTYHFLLFDGWSRELVLRELFALYGSAGTSGAVPPHSELVVQYLDRLAEGGEATSGAESAWRALLSGCEEPTLASGVEPGHPDAAPDTEPGRIVATVPPDVTSQLNALAQQLGVTLNAVVTTAVAAVTGYHAGTTDVLLGATVAGRPGDLVGIDETIGLFLNTVPVRVRLRAADTAASTMRTVHDQRLAMLRHDHLGLGQIQRAAGETGRELFDTLLVLQNFLDDDTFADLEADYGIVGVDYHDTTHFPLTWVLTPGRALSVKLEYRVIGDARAREMVDQLLAVLAAVARDPHSAAGALPLVETQRRKELEARWSSTARPVEAVTIAELLARQAQRRPDDTALVFGDHQLSYGDFDARVTRFARLLQARGATAESFVALALPRSVDMVVALFAVLRAGAAYLPLELDLPSERLRAIVDDARPTLLVTSSAGTELACRAAGSGIDVIALDDPATAEQLRASSDAPFAEGGVDLQNPAYLIYTSGSTGRPKGVLTPYAGLTNMYFNHLDTIFAPTVQRAGGRQVTVAHTVSFSFDMSWEELFWLVAGHCVHICDEDLRRDAPALVNYCDRHRVDVVNVTPTYAHHLLDAGLLDGHAPVLVLLGGEAVGDHVWSTLREHPSSAAYNLYGPTEYTINTLGGGTDDSVTPTVGQPIWNTRAYILDSALRPAPDGSAGELYIAGSGLARGYHRRTGQTAATMVADPFVAGGRMYRTGDLVRRRGDGHLDFLGRADDQVKIRGYRVEPGEVAAVLETAPGVARCAVVVRSVDSTPPSKTLVAYVIPQTLPADGGEFVMRLRDHLAAMLPSYMVPTRFAVVSTLPLTVNGKLDVAALPEPVAASRGTARAPRTPAEQILLEVVASVLGVTDIGVDDDFFTLGGDSISSIAVCGRARKAGLQLTPRDVFRRRTIAALAAAAALEDMPQVFADSGVGEITATPMLAETVAAGTPLDNFYQSMVLATPPDLTAAHLDVVLGAVIATHAMLRAKLDRRDDTWTLVVPESMAGTVEVTRGVLDEHTIDAATGSAAADLAPDAGVMMRAVWDPENFRLLLVIHHLVVDGVSWRIIGEDLARAWDAVTSGGDARLDDVPTSFRTWANTLVQKDFSGEADYWNGVLDTEDPDLGRRPLDPDTDTAATVRSHRVTLPADVSSALLSAVPAAMHGGVNDVLLTAFSLALAQWRADRGHEARTALLNLEGHGRESEELDLSRTVGWFTAIYPVRLEPGQLTWSEVLAAGEQLATSAKAVKEQLRAIPNAGLGYGVLRYLRDPAAVRGPAPQILFNYLGRFAGGSGRPWQPVAGVGALREGVDPANPAVALEINALAEDTANETTLSATLAWPSGLFDAADVESLAVLWVEALTALTRCDALRGHTPADFPLLHLTQADLDEWERDGGVEEVLPLLPLQEGMYFHNVLATGEDEDTYRVQQIAELCGPVQPQVLRDSILAVLRRHQGLRAGFRERHDGGLAQVIWSEPALEFDVLDGELHTVAQQQLNRPFDLARPPLVRYALVTVAPDEHRLIQTMHHIVADGWSYPVIFSDIVTHYNSVVRGSAGLRPLPVTLRDHIESVVGADRDTARRVWSEALAGARACTLLPTDTTTVGEHRSSVRHLSPTVTSALTRVARENGLTLSTVVHGAWGLVLGRLLGRRDVMFGSTVSGRGGRLEGTESIVGLLINTIAVPMRWEQDCTVVSVLADLQERQTALLDAQHVGLAELARLSGVRDLFDTMVVVENFPSVSTPAEDPDSLTYRGFTGSDAPHYPVSLVAYLDEQLTIEIKYDTSRSSQTQAGVFAERVELVLSAFAERPDLPVGRLEVRTAPEREMESDAVSLPGPHRTIADSFAEVVGLHPNSVALRCGDTELTYAALDQRASAVAAGLVERGVRPEARVAVALPRSVDLIVAIIAVIKAGGTYVPVDTASPTARLRHILTDARPVCALVDRPDRLDDAAPAGTPMLVLAELNTPTASSPEPQLHPDHSAYVIYTSGSTGAPKGVTVTHRDVAALFRVTEGPLFDIGPDDVWTMFHSAAFDFSVWELWGALLHGGRLVVVQDTVARDPEQFLELLERERVTVLNQTPSAFYPLIDADRQLRPSLALRYVVFGGEALDTTRLARWYQRHDAQSPQLVNMYGITETCVHVSLRALLPEDTRNSASVIGRPLPGLQIHVLDDALQPVPAGVVGEIYVAGGQLARGYLDKPALTATRFVADPFHAGQLLYRSGDAAMWTDTGELVYVGRTDQQVKVRGYRIELGDVESALAAVPGVVNAAAAVRQDDSGRTRLVGYLVGDRLDTSSVRAELEQHLPGYMVPSALVVLERLPLTVNGKLDRGALPDPADRPANAEPVAGGVAAQIAQLCTEILRTEVNVSDDFFGAGGDSIVAIQLVNRARRLGLRMTPQDVFTHRTPAALAATAAAADHPDTDAGQDNGEVMLTPIVARLAELGGTIDRFNQTELLLTPAGAVGAHLDAALTALTRRHDALRLRLQRPVPMLWSLEITGSDSVSLLQLDARHCDDDELRELIAIQSDEAATRLDPEAGPMLQAVWFDRGPQLRGRLLLVVHHLAVDAVSWQILVDDLAQAYADIAAGRPPALDPVPTSLRHYARMVNENALQAARLAEFERWTATLAPGGELVEGASATGLTVGDTRDHEVTLTTAQTVALLTADVTETLVTAVMLAVQRWRDSRGVTAAPLVLDVERHGRDGWTEMDLSRTVGWFTAITPVRLPADAGCVGQTALNTVKESLRQMPDGGLGFGQLRYNNPRTAAALGRFAPPQLLFNYLGRSTSDADADWHTAPESAALRVAPDPDLGTPYVLEINAHTEDSVAGPRLRATFTYVDGQLDDADVADLADAWVQALIELGEVSNADGKVLTPSDLPLVSLTQAQIDGICAVADGAEDIWPLSPLQEGVYFQARYADAAVYVVQNVFDFADPVDVTALSTAFRSVMRRNPVLRCGFHADDLPYPLAVVTADPVCTPQVVDLCDLEGDELEHAVLQHTGDDRLRTFDLARPPLARFTVLRTGRGDRLIFSYHFLLLDGWSREQLLRELFADYTAAKAGTVCELPTPTAGFTDYLRWLAGRDRAESARMWAARLDGLSAPTLLIPEAVGSAPTLASRLEFILGDTETRLLTQRARSVGVTLNAVIGTALALVLGYESGSDDVVFGSTVAGRPTEVDGIDSVIGLFLNTVPTRLRLSADRTTADVMRDLQSDRPALMDHEYLGLGEIQRAAGSDNRPLFDSLYVLQNFLDDDTFTDMEAEHGIVGHDSVDASHYPLTWVASPGRRLWVKLEYRPDVVAQAHAQRLLDRLQQVLLHLAHHDTALAAVPMVLPRERAELVALAQSAEHPLPQATVTDLLEAQVGLSADLPALVCGQDSVDYAELQRRVDQLAWILRDRGVGVDTTVGLAIPRSITAVVALFAVLRAGAAYLPLELDYPDERLAVMLADARPTYVLTTAQVGARLDGLVPTGCAVVSVDDLPGLEGHLTWDGRSPELDDPAYVIYTSGSTGTPKGVVTGHRGLTNMHLNHREAIFVPAITKAGGRRLRIAHTVSFSFDMSWEELLWLIEGHEVHICDENLRRDATALVKYCHEHEIDVINVTPSYAALLIEQGLLDADGHPPVLVLLGGEAVSTSVWDRLRSSDTSYGYNLYGPTEYTINTLGGGTDDSATPTVGQPIWNTTALILDSWLRQVPDGVPGELYIAGAGLARGYLRQPALTAGRFVANPISGGRMYRTGDLVCRRADGNIDFLGRTDDQVKIRGYRVEPGDVQTVLTAHPGVASAAVIARPDPTRLIAYVVPAAQCTADLVADVRNHAKRHLPGYMVPSAIGVVDALPLTANGKLDVRALPDVQPSSRDTRSPASAHEEMVCGLFCDLLGVKTVGAEDDFFELGGHSLLTIRLINGIRAASGAELTLPEVFDAPTPAELAALVSQRSSATRRLPLVAGPRPAQIPVSPAQARMLVLDRIGGTGAAYNYPLVFRVRGHLDLEAFRAAVGDVVDRHEVLRTVFADEDETLLQRILPPGTRPPFRVQACDAELVAQQVSAAVAHRFDLATEIPIRVEVLEAGPDDHTVVILLHHITTDEWSDTPLLADLDRAYRSRAAGADPQLPPLRVQYADYSLWLRDMSTHNQMGFWRDTLADAPDELALPTDRDRPALPSGSGGTVHVDLSEATATGVRTLAVARQLSPLMVLHAAVALLLHRLGAGEDIVVGTPVAGRSESALDEVIGLFVNTVVLRCDVSGNPTIEDLLSRVREADLAAFAHQEVPFEHLVEALNPPRVAGRNPLFNVFVGYHRDTGQDTALFGLDTTWQEPAVTAAMFDLGFTLVDGPAGATVMAEYSSDLFDEASVRTLAGRLVSVLDQVVRATTRRVSTVDVLLDDELRTVTVDYNNTSHPVPPADLAAAVHRQAQSRPAATAVIFDGEQLDYTELDRWSDQLAARLLDAGDHAVIGVALPRSLELVVALLAVAKTGAAFLPLDPEYPPERLRHMIDDARPAMVVDDTAQVRAARADPHRRPERVVDPSSWAYVLYTSGSTGKPKGVAVPHAGITNRIAWLQHAYPLSGEDRMLMKTPIGFDTSVWEVFWPLSAGATLVVAQPGGHRDPRYLADVIADQQVTAVDFVPSMLELFLDDLDVGRCASLTRVTVGGEALSDELARRFTAVFGDEVALHNLYGPTEASVDVLGWTADGGPVALGRPGWNVRAHVLDRYLEPVPPGTTGELYLAGVQLADGYLNQNALTAQRFVADPFGSGSRLYRTGDVVRWRNDAQLEYLGRSDDQIKLRGVRIEPGEIEAVLGTHAGVASARVTVRDDRLVAYYTTTGIHCSPQELRVHATASLPGHMAPSAYVEVAQFPLTPNGKLDRKALPPPRPQRADSVAGTHRQQRLSAVFAKILGVDWVGLDDDFFTLGGHSLLLVRLAAALRREFGAEISVGELMMAATVRAVEARLAGAGSEADSLAPVLPLRTGGSAPPLFCVHPASGLSWQFSGLKRHLPQSIPLYGLQSPLFSGTALPDSIDELAAQYADTVHLISPTGPIRLLGWSFGGALAVLIAAELVARGRDVSWVGMLDARTDVAPETEFDPEQVLAGLMREMGFRVAAGTRLSVAEAVRLVRDSDDAIGFLDDDQIALVIQNYVAAERLTAAADYRTYSGDVFFVDATVMELDLHGVASHGWAQHLTGRVRVLPLECGHSELLDAAILEQLGPVIAEELT
ncbi:non-ribosomal peptide synthetase [Mycobacterium sp. MS1601]|uniref:non-ribosomal peptide synthetase n=1 Tax=Mycobacterium sp. MS1601 TaxID=1936029 RepID=UPI001F00CF8C|nr:non-ribosomal peptide synthetase [Mycobacterium sp. MS1601]